MNILVDKDDFSSCLALGLGVGNCRKSDMKRKEISSNSMFGSEREHKPLLTLTLSHDGLCGSVTEKFVEDVTLAKRLSSPNSTVSSYSTGCPKEKDDGEVERGSFRVSDEDDDGGAKKKLRLTKEQSAFLEDQFKEHSTLNPKQKQALAKQLNLRPRQVEVWFQNRRARTKLKQTEVDCEFLKNCCQRLTEENQRLHKELQELKSLKFAQPLYMQFPAATLKICPSCENIKGANDASKLNNPFPNSAAC